MRINNIQITSASTLEFDCTLTAPICAFCGHYSDLALDLIREVIGDYGAQNDPDRVDDGNFVINSSTEIDNKKYEKCYIRNADFMGDNRMAVNFKPRSIDFSHDDTEEYLCKLAQYSAHNGNVFNIPKRLNLLYRSESDRYLYAFDSFFKGISFDDDRPIFVYDFFERIDESVSVTPYLDALAAVGRQVFIAVCSNYPTKKLKHDAVQIVNTEADDGDN